MLNPGGKVYRGTVVTSSPYTGEVSVLLSGFGVTDSVITISNVSRRMVSNRWTVPTIGEQVYVTGDDEDLTNAFLLTANNDSDTATGEPMGHEDKTKSTVAFNATTQTFTIAPVGVEHAVWCMGRRIVKRAAESLTLPNTTGSYAIFYDQNGFLNYQLDRFTLSEQTPTAYVYWNATTQRAEIFADERHGIVLDWQTHEYLHRTRGASFANGFDAYNFTTAGTGSANTDAQVSIANGTFFDEDLEIAITHSATPTANTWQQRLQGPAYLPCFYRSGTEWQRDTATLYPLKSGATLPVYNSYSAPNWGVTELGNNKYGITWVVATNNLSEPVMGIIGQAEYNNLGDAEAVLWTSMNLTSLPVHEMRPLYKVVYQVAGAYTNTPKAAIRGVYDIRIATTTAGTSSPTLVIDHGSLTGLADDDHTQYFNQTRGDARYIQIGASLPAASLTGTVNTARLSGSYTGITNVGTLLTSSGWSNAGWAPALRATQSILLEPGVASQRWLLGTASDGRFFLGYNTAGDTSQAPNYPLYIETNGVIKLNNITDLVGGPMNIYQSNECLRLAGTNPYIGFWNAAISTRVGYFQGVNGDSLRLVTDTGSNRLYIGTEVFHVRNNALAADRFIVTSTYVGTVLPFEFSNAGTPTSDGAGVIRTTSDGSKTGVTIKSASASNVIDFFMAFYDTANGSSAVGSIFSPASTATTTYSTTSDYRLKRDDVPLVGSLERVKALRPISYRWKRFAESPVEEGFFAHEVQEIVPCAAFGEKDAVDDEGNVVAQQIDLARLVPVLVGAVQELAERLNYLEASQ